MIHSRGDWRARSGRQQRRLTIEECHWRLDIGEMRRWFTDLGLTDLVRLRCWWGREKPTLQLDTAEYPLPTRRGKTVPFQVLWTYPEPWRVYGVRWWFRCSQCQSRRSVLFARVVGDWFLCRECHDLTYDSSQRWHNLSRTGYFPGRFGPMMTETALEHLALMKREAARWARDRQRSS